MKIPACRFCSGLLPALLVVLLGLQNALAFPVVTNFAINAFTYAPGPVTMSFAPDGTLFVGRDNTSQGGGPADAVKIYKVAKATPVVRVEYGNVPIIDPDAVIYDAIGRVSGTPGSILVGGSAGASGAMISMIAPNQTVSTLFGGPVAAMGNPGAFLFDSSGRVFISDSTVGKVFVATSPSVPPVELLSSTGAYEIAFDASNRLAVASFSLPRIQLFSTNGTLISANFASARVGAPLVAGPGDEFWGRDLYSVTTNGNLVRIDPSGNVTVVGSGFATNLGGNNAYAGKEHLAFGPDNALYYADRNYYVYKIFPTPYVDRSPTHWWPLDGTLEDIAGGEHGAASNGTFFASGKFGQSFEFFGTNYINLGTNAGGFAEADFSITLWVKVALPSITTGAPFLEWKTNGCPAGFFWQAGQVGADYSTSPSFLAYGASAYGAIVQPAYGVATNELKDGFWHHLAFVREGKTVSVYRDGVLIGKEINPTGFTASLTGQLVAGHAMCSADGSQVQYRGLLDEIKTFAVALTPTEVGSDMIGAVVNPVMLTGGKMSLSWPMTSGPLLIETNSSLGSTGTWRLATTNAHFVNGRFTHTNAVGPGNLFFRLRKP